MATTRTVTTDQSNDETIIPCPTTDPAASLSNNEIIIWMDDASNSIRMAGKDDSGTSIAFNSTSGVSTSTANDWTGQQNFIESTLTDAASISWDMNTEQNAQVTITANRTMNAPTNLKVGGKYTLRIIQDGTGSRTMAYNAVYKFDGSVVPVLDETVGASTILNFYSDGTNLYLTGSSKQVIPMDGTTGDTPIWNNSTKQYDLVSPGAAGTVLKSNGALLAPSYGTVSGGGGGGSGDVVGPAVAVDNGIVVFDSTTGKLVKATNTDITAGTQKITDVVDPTADQHASTKNYADTSPTIADATTTRTLTDSDSGSVIHIDNASAITVTLDTGLKSGFGVTLVQKGAGAITVDGTATLNGTTGTSSQYGILIIVPDASTDVYVGSPNGGSSTLEIAIFEDVQTAGTNGGTATSGSQETRTLNTSNTLPSWASLSSNQMIIDIGLYMVEGSCAGFDVGGMYSILRRISPAGNEIVSESGYPGTDVMEYPKFSGIVEVTADSSVFELQSIVNSTKASTGMGLSRGVTVTPNQPDKFAIVKWTKLDGVGGLGGSVVVPSEVSFTDMAGHGATNVKIVHFTNFNAGDSNHLTGTHDATDGDSVLVNTSGVYAVIAVRDFSGVNNWQGLSVNASNVTTTNLPDLPIAEQLIAGYSASIANGPRDFGITRKFTSGDIIRVHDTGAARGTNFAKSKFIVVGPL